MMNDQSYSSLASFYDRLSSDIDQISIAKFTLEKYKEQNKRMPKSILDLACGTGNLSIELAKNDIEVIGVDISCEMLSIAYNKSKNGNLDILFLEQDMCNFELYGTVDMIVCYFDSINHVLDKTKIEDVFRLAYNYLEPNGIFMFDVNSLYTFENIYGNNVYHEVYDDLEYIWQNELDENENIVTFYLTIFQIESDGRYTRYEDMIKEQYYTEQELKVAYEKYFELVDTKDGFSHKNVTPETSRIFHILKKRENLFK